LLVTLLIATFAYWAVITWLTVRDSVDEVYELFDVHLAQTALALLRLTDPDDSDPLVISRSVEAPKLSEIFTQWPELPERLAASRASSKTTDAPEAPFQTVITGSVGKGSIRSLHEEYEKRLRYQVWSREGRLLLRSANAPDTMMAEQDGFSKATDREGQVWRNYGVWDKHHDFRIVVAEAHDLRNRLVRNITLHVVSPLVLGMPVLIFLLWFSISRSLDPLKVLTREIATRKPENLTPLDSDAAPGEVRPIVIALNKLLGRMTHSLESERQFTANAAHELRTPLAAIQAHLHAARGAEGDVERMHAMDQLQRGVERGIRLVGQLLTLARLDPEQSLRDVQPVSLGEVAETVCAQLAPLALQRDQVLELHVEPNLPSPPGNADMLSMLLSNLLDNAIIYTQSGGHIGINISRCTGGVLMEVSDDGPGIPAEQRKTVFERFYRLAGQNQPGTGLGLAICQRIAELHSARITLSVGLNDRGVIARVVLEEGYGPVPHPVLHCS
jgi:two-component system sensor histidine kinase QseC